MRILLFMMLMLAFGCMEKKKEPFPIAEERLPDILLDVQLAESAMQNLYGVTKDSMAEVYYDQVCVIHDLDRETLDNALDRLRDEPEMMLRVYNRMMDLITEREAQSRN